MENLDTDTPVEKIRLAGFWIRFTANGIDGTLLTVVSIVLQGLILFPVYWIYLIWTARGGQPVNQGFFQFYSPLFLEFFNAGLYGCLAFPYYVWGHYKNGTTIGKHLLGIEVVDRLTGQRLSLNASIRRCLGYLLSYGLVGAGFLMVAFNSQKLGLHDWIAGSMSRRTR